MSSPVSSNNNIPPQNLPPNPEDDSFQIDYKPSTSLAEVKNSLEVYLDLAREVCEECEEDDPKDVEAFCKKLDEWLEEEHQDLDPLDALEYWRGEVNLVKEGDISEAATFLPVIFIQK